MNEMPFAYRIRELRENKGLTKAEIARALGLSGAAYWFYEDGRYRPAKIELYEKLASILGCEVSYLIYDDERFTDMEEQKTEEINIGEPAGKMDLSFGQRVKRLREEKQMSADEVAAIAGINESTLRKYESDNTLPTRSEIVGRIAKALGCSVSYLMDAIYPLTDNNPKKELGRRLRNARIETGVSANEFARKIGIPPSTYIKYEGGHCKPKDVGIYDTFAEALGVDGIIFRELDSRCSEYDKTIRSVDPTSPGWETVSGVYADDDPIEPHSKVVSADNIKSQNKDAVNMPASSVILEDEADAVYEVESVGNKASVDHVADPDLRPADLMHEIIQMISRISALLAGNRLTREEKDIIKASLEMAYREGTCE